MNKEQKILTYADSNLSNAEIAEAVGCTRRHVRGVLGAQSARMGTRPVGLPKILVYDVETAPMEVYSWRTGYNLSIPMENIIKDWSLLTWSAKWLFDPTVYSQKVTPEEAHNRDDSSIIQGLWDMVDESDIIVAHNALRFDEPRMKARFLSHGMMPPRPYRVIDTYREARKHFSTASWKLDYLTKFLECSELKDPQGFQLWVDCVSGNHEVAEAALTKMETYNGQDVFALEELYLKLRPWMKSHVNVALFIDTDTEVCSNCGNSDLDWNGYYYTPAGRYKSFRCQGCGAIGRSRFSDLTSEEREVLAVGTAR